MLGLLLLMPNSGAADEGRSGLAQWMLDQELSSHRQLLAHIATGNPQLRGFVSDGCSGGLSAGWQQVARYWPGFAARYSQAPPFEPCCVVHDRAYHDITGVSSAEASYRARLLADQSLRHCVQQMAAEDSHDLAEAYGVDPELLLQTLLNLSEAMYFAVRFGGGPCSGLPWRWGFGYSEC